MKSQKNFKVKNNIYKILRPSEWEEASQTGQINTDLDRGDGFIHLSAAYQLNATLSFFFKDWIGHMISHFVIIIDGQIRYGIGILFAVFLKFKKDLFPITAIHIYKSI